MKILFSLLAFCLFASCVHSQEAVDTVSVRVQYRVKYNERNMKLRDKEIFAHSICGYICCLYYSCSGLVLGTFYGHYAYDLYFLV